MSLHTFQVKRTVEGDILMPAHKVIKFPGGEAHIDFEQTPHQTQIAYMTSGNGDDLASLAQWADACHRKRLTTFAVIPYLPGARMDRGVPLGAKVYADIINSFNLDYVIAADPHSDVAPALYNNLSFVSAAELIDSDYLPALDGVIAPDRGAEKRASEVAQMFDVPYIQAGKHRDFKTGKLSGFWCDPLPKRDGHYLMVDDICDGGGTFNGLAEVIAYDTPDAHLNLWVTHGIFSKGLADLLDNFERVLTTDSHDGAQSLNENSYFIKLHIMKKLLTSTGRFMF